MNAGETYTLNCGAIRTLHTLERTLRDQIAALHEIGCEDMHAADAIVFAIESVEKALANTRAARSRMIADAKAAAK